MKHDNQADTREQQVLALVQRQADAERQADIAALDALLDPDFLLVGPRGFLLTKQQYLERFGSGGLRIMSFEWHDPQIRLFGNTAILVGTQVQQASYQGRDASGQFRSTLVAVQAGDHWRVVGLHLSPIAEIPQGRER